MKITHCISSIDKSTGGPAEYIRLLLNRLSKNQNVELTLETLQSELPYDFNSKVKVKFHFFNKIGYSRSLKKSLKNSLTHLFHGNGLWGLSVHQMAKVARMKKMPYVLSVHGCLDPISLNNKSYWKKYLALKIYQHKDLKLATCLHATAKKEMNNFRALGYTNPIAIIPNGIDLNEYPLKNNSVIKGKRKVLFLSRIHEQKGIEYLIKVWAQIDSNIRQNWELEIAGNGELVYIEQLNQIIKIQSLQKEIKIVGPKFGKDKIATYHSASLFVLPSYSENFGIVVAEALASGLPVITTMGTPWEELETYSAGKWIELVDENLLDSMTLLMKMEEKELQEIGKRGRMLIEKNYSIDSVGDKFLKLYQWLLHKGEKPDFVYLK
ncbi:glycosyltransferase [Flavobacterium sp. NG2]|uniref:glycosyltransferase n=1 Tax=Flavobacterium sp. NG2 TaxID=3097547 RepID=UPI002A7F31E3|nr:glycosyltransferase [Flavobacterium sp. NG2]WPR71645.1 glycosyltransferase [Flavobacterium sp. NG2]